MLTFSLVNPWMLTGVVLAAIPLLIHLFYRKRYQEVQWAAVIFLSSAVRRNAQRNRLQQLLLLLLRTLAIVALVIGFARPLVDDSLVPLETAGRKHNVLVIDASLSMRCREEDGTRFERAVDVAKSIVAASNDGDSFQLLTTAGRTPQTVIGRPTADTSEVLTALETLQCSANAGEIRTAWPATRRLLESANTNAETTVYVLSDFQSREWQSDPTDAGASELNDLGRDAKLSLVDVTDSFAPNLSVSNLRVEQNFVSVNQQATFRVALQNNDAEPVTDQEVRFLIDDRVVSSKRVSVKPYTRLNIPFEHRMTNPGMHRLSVEIDADRLPDDNRVHYALKVHDDIPILLVNGKLSSEHMGNATDFLKLSLAPAVEAGWRTPYQVRVVSEVEFGTIDPTIYAAVFLCNVRQFTTDETTRLHEYVLAGGSVVLCLGDLVDAQNYNSRLLGPSGIIAGVQLVETVGDAARPTTAFEFDTTDLSHPLMTVYQGNPGHGLEQVLTFQYIKAEVAESSTSRIALRFRNGDPVLIEAAMGAGTACIATISADSSRWSTWNTTSGTFVSLINEVTEFVVSGRETDRMAVVGQPWSRPVVRGDVVASAVVDDGTTQPIRVVQNSSGDELIVDELAEPGFLTVSASDREYLVAGNVDPGEADLRAVSESTIRSRVLPDTELSFAKARDFAVSSSSTAAENANEASFAMFAIVAALLIAELLLASRVPMGAWLVFAVGAAVVFAVGLFPQHRNPTIAAVAAAAMVFVLRKWLARRFQAFFKAA